MKTKLYRIRLIGTILVYLVAATFTWVDKFPNIDQLDLGINLEYWGSTGGFLVAVAFWFNLFLYSILPVLIAILAVKDKLVIYCSYALPLFWGFLLYLSIIDTGRQSDVLLPDIKYFIYGFLTLSVIIILVKFVILVLSYRAEETKTIEDLEKFKKKALKKLEKVNPKHNQKLFEDTFGSFGEAINMLMATYHEDDIEKKDYLIRMSLDQMAASQEDLDKVHRRLAQYATISGEQPPKDKLPG